MALGVKRGEHDVAAGDGHVAERVPPLVLEAEGGHGDELARQLAQAEVDLVVAGVCGAGDEMAGFDAEQDRLHLARRHRNCDRLLAGSDPQPVVVAHGDRHGQQLTLLRRRGDGAGHRTQRRPAGAAVEADAGRGD